jgi:hypothetical protein
MLFDITFDKSLCNMGLNMDGFVECYQTNVPFSILFRILFHIMSKNTNII